MSSHKYGNKWSQKRYGVKNSGKFGKNKVGKYKKYEPEKWDKKCGKSFEDWIEEKLPKGDDAYRLLFNPNAPYQCPKCKKLNRHQYVPGTSRTELVYVLCEDCRYGGIKMMNMEYFTFIHEKGTGSDDDDDESDADVKPTKAGKSKTKKKKNKKDKKAVKKEESDEDDDDDDDDCDDD